jgi:hypothetical protein
LFCTIIQLSITKLKILGMKSTQQHNISVLNQSVSQTMALNKLNTDEILSAQNFLFSIISYTLDALQNYMPNFADSNYLNKLDEYRLLLALHLTQPSSFDLQAQLAFGSVLWLVDQLLKMVHKHDSSLHVTQSSASSSTLVKSKSVLDDKQNNLSSSPVASSDTTSSSSPKKNVTIDDAQIPELKLPSKYNLIIKKRLFFKYVINSFFFNH